MAGDQWGRRHYEILMRPQVRKKLQGKWHDRNRNDAARAVTTVITRLPGGAFVGGILRTAVVATGGLFNGFLHTAHATATGLHRRQGDQKRKYQKQVFHSINSLRYGFIDPATS